LNITPPIEQIPGYPGRNHDLEKIIFSGLNSADPILAVKNTIQWSGNQIHIKGLDQGIGIEGKVFLVGAGKASVAMAQGISEILGGKVQRGAIITKVLPKERSDQFFEKIRVFKGDHPVPGVNSIAATRKTLKICSKLDKNDLVICLISGGGSALLAAPVVGVKLDEIQEMTRILLDCGADIGEINTLRKHLDLVKGGGLAKTIAPASILTLAISDVIGSPPSIIASGPTTPDESTFQDAWTIIEKYHLEAILPESILMVLKKGLMGKIPETLKQGDPIFQKTTFQIIASNESAVEASLQTANGLGYNTVDLGSEICGEARVLGNHLATQVRTLANERNTNQKPVCQIGGGESTVTRKGVGFGGRNLETALGAVEGLSDLEGVCLVTLATDGEDGPTDAAGAVVTGETLKKGFNLGMHPAEFLATNNSYRYFEKVGGLIKLGSTGTNVMDMFFLFRF